MIALFCIGLTLHASNILLPALLRDSRRLNVASNLLNAVALLCGLSFSLNALLAYRPVEYRFELPAAGPVLIGFDGLSLFFLFTFQLLSLAASLYAIGYLRHYIERARPFRSRTPVLFHAADPLAPACGRRSQCARLSRRLGIDGAWRLLLDRFRPGQRRKFDAGDSGIWWPRTLVCFCSTSVSSRCMN